MRIIRYSGETEKANIIAAQEVLGWELVAEYVNQDSTTDLGFDWSTSLAATRISALESIVQSAPAVKTTACTLAIAEILGGLIIGEHTAGATQAYTLPTGTLCEAGQAWVQNGSKNWALSNLSAAEVNTITITANTDHTFVGQPIVKSLFGASNNCALLRTRRVAENSFVTYRIS